MWPTPTVKTGAQVAWDKTPGQTGGTSLAGAVQYFPTPTRRDYKGAASSRVPGHPRHAHNLDCVAEMATGKKVGMLNAQWVAWMMGWPLNHTLIGGRLSQTWAELPLITKTEQRN